MDQDEDLETRVAALELQLERQNDAEEIRDVLVRYSRALDWLDPAMLDKVIFDDAEMDYGFFKGTGKEFKPILMEIERGAGRRWHFTAQVKIQLDGHRAEVESYNLSIVGADSKAAEGFSLTHFAGYYQDRLEKRAGRWGIAWRKHLLVSGATLREVPMTGDFAALNLIGAADQNHPDYRTLGG